MAYIVSIGKLASARCSLRGDAAMDADTATRLVGLLQLNE